MSDSPRSGSPSLESDFRDLRDARGLSLEDLNAETRVPIDVLRRFESGALLSDGTFNDVYLRAFVKSYANALGIPEARARGAFEAHRAGQYQGQLRDDYVPPKAPPPPVVSEPEADVLDSRTDLPGRSAPPSRRGSALPPEAPAPKSPAPEAPPKRASGGAAPAVDALRSGGSAAPSSSRTAETIAPARVRKPIEPGARRSFDKNWGTIGGLAFVLLAVCAAAVWFLVFRTDGEETDGDTELTAEQTDGTVTDSTATDSGPVGPRLQTPITVVAEATEGGLQWFRVTQDSGDRSPAWIDEGTSQTYTADSTLIVWGEGNANDTAYDFEQTTLEIQGMRWRPANGAPVRITLQNGQALLDSLASAGVSVAPQGTPEASGAQTE